VKYEFFFPIFWYKEFGQNFQILAQLVNSTIGEKIQDSPNFFVEKMTIFYRQQNISVDYMTCKRLLVTKNSQGAGTTRLCPITNDLKPITKHNHHPL
jgi:hypothetical protein